MNIVLISVFGILTLVAMFGLVPMVLELIRLPGKYRGNGT